MSFDKYRGITHPLPAWGWLLRIWERLMCKRDCHLFDEVATREDNYLSCDACQLIVDIERIDDSYTDTKGNRP